MLTSTSKKEIVSVIQFRALTFISSTLTSQCHTLLRLTKSIRLQVSKVTHLSCILITSLLILKDKKKSYSQILLVKKFQESKASWVSISSKALPTPSLKLILELALLSTKQLWAHLLISQLSTTLYLAFSNTMVQLIKNVCST